MKASNGIDKKKDTKELPVSIPSWSHVLPEIALAKVSELGISDSWEIRQDIETIIKSMKQQKLLGVDNIQHGNLGLTEFLLLTGRKLDHQELVKAAMTLSKQVIVRANQRGYFNYGLSLNFHPGFFQGESGIGYELLRLVYPDILPSVLLWN